MQAKYPDDNFEAVIRKNATSGIYEFRIKCADCPGKVGTPSPTLTPVQRLMAAGASTIRLVREKPSRTSRSTLKIANTAPRSMQGCIRRRRRRRLSLLLSNVILLSGLCCACD